MDDGLSKLWIGAIPLVLALSGWALSVETRIEKVITTQVDRSVAILDLRRDHDDLHSRIERIEADPSPRPAAKVVLDEHQRRLDTIERRVNNLHEYLIQLPIRPPPFNGKRGDTISPIIR